MIKKVWSWAVGKAAGTALGAAVGGPWSLGIIALGVGLLFAAVGGTIYAGYAFVNGLVAEVAALSARSARLEDNAKTLQQTLDDTVAVVKQQAIDHQSDLNAVAQSHASEIARLERTLSQAQEIERVRASPDNLPVPCSIRAIAERLLDSAAASAPDGCAEAGDSARGNPRGASAVSPEAAAPAAANAGRSRHRVARGP